MCLNMSLQIEKERKMRPDGLMFCESLGGLWVSPGVRWEASEVFWAEELNNVGLFVCFPEGFVLLSWEETEDGPEWN